MANPVFLTEEAIARRIAPDYSTSATYEVGEIVLYDGVAYKCVTAITTSEEWTAAHWTAATDADLAARLKGFKSDGNSTDRFATDLLGKQVAKEAIIYKANTATGLKDRAFNALSLDGTEYNLSTALAAVTPTVENQPRDLLIVATATASTTISFTAGTIKGDKPTIDGAGTWLITLTEYAANTWYCRQIKMEDAA